MPLQKCTVVKNIQLNRNVFKLSLLFEDELPVLNASICVRLYNDAGESRPYTPLSLEGPLLEFPIKAYADGAVSSYLAGLPPGSTVMASEFIVKREYQPNEHGNVLMLCGGTGLVPMIQILERALPCSANRTKFELINFNTSAKDIFLADQLYRLQGQAPPDHLRITHIYTGGQGSHTPAQDIIRKLISGVVKAAKFDYVYVCGTRGFQEYIAGPKSSNKQQRVLAGLLKELEFDASSVFQF